MSASKKHSSRLVPSADVTIARTSWNPASTPRPGLDTPVGAVVGPAGAVVAPAGVLVERPTAVVGRASTVAAVDDTVVAVTPSAGWPTSAGGGEDLLHADAPPTDNATTSPPARAARTRRARGDRTIVVIVDRRYRRYCPAMATCESCGADDDDLVVVHRVYVTPQSWESQASVRVQPDTERWCYSCATSYPNEPVASEPPDS